MSLRDAPTMATFVVVGILAVFLLSILLFGLSTLIQSMVTVINSLSQSYIEVAKELNKTSYVESATITVPIYHGSTPTQTVVTVAAINYTFGGVKLLVNFMAILSYLLTNEVTVAMLLSIELILTAVSIRI